MEITVTAETPRPLIDTPMGVTVAQGQAPVLTLNMVKDIPVQDVAIEYVARFYGNTTMEVIVEGDILYGVQE